MRLTANEQEELTCKSITWYQSGSASGLANVMTVVNGTSYPTTVDATGRYYTATFPTSIVIPKGSSLDAYVTADLGSNTTSGTVAQFDIYRATDVYLVGNTYGFGITPPDATNGVSTASAHATAILTGTNPWFQGSTVSVTAGSISTIQNATSVPAQNIAINVLGQPLGGFSTNLLGEPITAQKIKVHFNYGTTAAASNLLTNVSLVNENGVVVAGPYNGVVNTGTEQIVTFTGSITFPTGLHTYTLKGQIPSTVTAGDTIQASTTPSTDWSSVTGNVTGNNITLPTSQVTMNTMTMKGASLNVANGTTPTSQNIVAGGQNVLLATVQLDASQSGEDIRLSSVPVVLTVAGGALVTDLSACQLFSNGVALNTGSRVVNSSNWAASGSVTTFSLDNALTVPKGTVGVLTLQCNVSSGAAANGTYQIAISAVSGNYSVQGSVSGNTVTPTFTSAGTGPVMTVSGAATLAVATDPSSPSYVIVPAGSTGTTVNVIKFRATNEGVNLQKVGLTLTNAASSSPGDLVTVYLYAGSNLSGVAPGTLLGTATFAGSATVATSTLNTPVLLPNNQDATIIVKADVAAVSTSQPGTEGHLIAIDYLNAQGTGASSGKTVFGAALTGSGSAGIRVFRTVPTFALDTSLPTTGAADGRLMEFKVTADSPGNVGIDKFTFNISTSTMSVTNIQLFAYTDPGYSTAVSGNYRATNGQFGATVTSVSGSNFSITATTNPLEVPAGQTYSFKLFGTPSGVTTGATVITKLLGDSAYPSLPPSTFVASTTAPGIAASNFIWSPNATTTAGFNDADWTNGYGVVGLPAAGLIQSRGL